MDTTGTENAGNTLLLVGLIFVGVGGPMLAVAVFLFFRTRRFLETAVSTTGTIIDLIESRGSEGGTVYKAVVAFKTPEGRDVQWTESMASNPPAGQPGDEVPVKYDPADPEKARIAKPFRLWFLPGLLGGPRRAVLRPRRGVHGDRPGVLAAMPPRWVTVDGE